MADYQYYSNGQFISHAQSTFWDGNVPVLYFRVQDALYEPYKIEAVIVVAGEISEDNLGQVMYITIGSTDSALRCFGGDLVRYQYEGTTQQSDEAATESPQIGFSNDQYIYRVWLAPDLWGFSKEVQFRIMEQQNKSTIVTTILTDAQITTASQLPGDDAMCATNTQYGETTLDYIIRLMQEIQAIAYFDYTQYIALSPETPIDISAMPLAEQFATPPVYSIVPNLDCVDAPFTLGFEGARVGDFTFEQIQEFKLIVDTVRGGYQLTGYNFTTPETEVVGTASTDSWLSSVKSVYPVSDQDSPSATDHANVVLAREISHYQRFVARTTSYQAAAGRLVTVEGSAVDDLNATYFIEKSEHILEYNYEKNNYEYRNIIEGVLCTDDPEVSYTPRKTKEKPQIIGTQTAIVIGSQDNPDINVDSFGRIQVKFQWCADTNNSADYTNVSNPSTWIRLMQWGAAGNGWGNLCIPRVGQEVVVTFLNGDPDNPIVMGAVFNGTNQFPSTLPDNNATLVMKTQTTGTAGADGSRYNEFTMGDTPYAELVTLRAQNDADFNILNDSLTTIGNDQATTVGGDVLYKVTSGDRYELFGSVTVDAGTVLAGTVAATSLLLPGAQIDMQSIDAGVKAVVVTTGAYAIVVGLGDMSFAVPKGIFDIVVDIYALVTKGKCTTAVGGSCSLMVAGSNSVDVIGDNSIDVGGEFSITVGGIYSTNVTGDYKMSTEGLMSISVIGELSIESAAFSITCADLTIDAAAITITADAAMSLTASAMFSVKGATVSVAGAMVSLG